MMGPSHHFFRTFMKDQSSPKIESRPRMPPLERAIKNLLVDDGAATRSVALNQSSS
jgi:hypothetical protein